MSYQWAIGLAGKSSRSVDWGLATAIRFLRRARKGCRARGEGKMNGALSEVIYNGLSSASTIGQEQPLPWFLYSSAVLFET